ncbi:hypothetical protein FOA52_013447 [Chlamydomonas sp. UWO 241]|nr:hypothetical protein FOA52_013447 [Chlamydomonas sp. UWO 241]
MQCSSDLARGRAVSHGLGRRQVLVPRASQAAPKSAKDGKGKRDAKAATEPAAAALPSVSEMRQRLTLYNTLTRSKSHFAPRPHKGDTVQMYVCGVTVYDYSHIGHARVYVAFDVLYRVLQHLQYDVQYVRNFTDIDDKIIARGNERGEDPLALSRRFITEFHKDMAAIGCLPPTLEPKATDFIPEMIVTIQKIIANGHAYTVEGDVYFEVNTLPGYGRLSGRQQDDNRAGERVDVDTRKRGPADFALWKSAKPGEPSWESPWGQGRPGWHIECSSMIGEVMGDVIDIHGGGRDLVFPHHENELAQSRAAAGPCCGCGSSAAHTHGGEHADASRDDGDGGASSSRSGGGGEDSQHQQQGSQQQQQEQQGQQQQQQEHGSGSGSGGGSDEFVRFWLHNGFVNVDSEKMSKSLGNFFTIREAVAKYHALALRWFLVSTQYRQQVNYTQRALEEASDRLYYLYQSALDIGGELDAQGDAGATARASAAAEIGAGTGPGAALLGAATGCLLDDLNTPAAVAELSGPLKAANDLLTTKAGRKRPDRLPQLAALELGIAAMLRLLGLAPGQAGGAGAGAGTVGPLDASSVEGALQQMRSLALARAGLTEADVAARLAARSDARAAKDFASGDAIRDELAASGVMVMDTPGGSSWRPCAVGGDGIGSGAPASS